MSKKPTKGGYVQISGRRYRVDMAPIRYGEWCLIVVALDGVNWYVARSEAWRCGRGPWKLVAAPAK